MKIGNSRKTTAAGLLLSALLLSTSGGFAMGKKRPSELDAYATFDAQASQVFQQISNVSWEQVKALSYRMLAPDGELRDRTCTWRKTLRVGLDAEGKNFTFASPTWTGMDGGGGYAVPVPVYQHGFRSAQDGTYEFMVYAHFEGFVDPQDNRMKIQAIKPFVLAAEDIATVKKAIEADTSCPAPQQSFWGPYACTTAEKVFDYVLLTFDPGHPKRLKITGRAFGEPEPVVEIVFDAAQRRP